MVCAHLHPLTSYACDFTTYLTFILIGTDACAVPVLTPKEAAQRAGNNIPMPHPQLSARANMGAPADSKNLLMKPGAHTLEVLQEYGINSDRIKSLHGEGVFGSVAWTNSKL